MRFPPLGRILLLAGLIVFASSARAAIPVSDAAQLDSKAQTSSTTVKLVPVTKKRQEANNGVNCAVTTGKKADISDPTVKPVAGAGAKAIEAYAPNPTATPAANASSGNQQQVQTTGDIVGGLDASRQTLAAAQAQFRSASGQVGSAPTVMAAIDMNSAARIQNGMSWNSAANAANLWVSALNALNLVKAGDMSRAASGMRAGAPVAPAPTGPGCPAGMIGSGTTGDPCRRAPLCSTTPPGATPDPNCVTARTVDSDDNVLIYLARMQDQNRAAATSSSSRTSTATGAPVVAAADDSSTASTNTR